MRDIGIIFLYSSVLTGSERIKECTIQGFYGDDIAYVSPVSMAFPIFHMILITRIPFTLISTCSPLSL